LAIEETVKEAAVLKNQDSGFFLRALCLSLSAIQIHKRYSVHAE
jgi:hypothetical protein